jgi:hypothetical protein
MIWCLVVSCFNCLATDRYPDEGRIRCESGRKIAIEGGDESDGRRSTHRHRCKVRYLTLCVT